MSLTENQLRYVQRKRPDAVMFDWDDTLYRHSIWVPDPPKASMAM